MNFDAAITIVMVVAMVAVWWLGLFPFHSRRNSLWLAFTATAASALYVGAGIIGYDLDRHSRFVAHASWSPTVIWPEVGIGLVLIPVAAYFWRKGLRDTPGTTITRS